jgi:hypothetical protein
MRCGSNHAVYMTEINKISGTIPTELEQMSSLTFLNLRKLEVFCCYRLYLLGI